jgi:hypothetical protein
MTGLAELDRMILLCREYLSDQASDTSILDVFRNLRVRCISDASNASCHAGQSALFSLVSLLARMGMRVILNVPDVRTVSYQPPFSCGSVLESLMETELIPGVRVSLEGESAADLTFVLGDSDASSTHGNFLRLTGGDWDAALSINQPAATARRWTGTWPIGAMGSAALAANEALKLGMRRLPLRCETSEVFTESRNCYWDFGYCPTPRCIDLGMVDIISAGAISQAALFCLARVPGIQMSGYIFDHDTTSLSNFNRNMLTVPGDLDRLKARLCSSRCAQVFDLTPVAARYSSAHQLSGRVLVGVDDIPSRWVVQRNSPGWVGVSGTSHFSISSSSHRMSEPCSGCLHPIDDATIVGPIPTISYVSFWAGLSLAVRLLREHAGMPYPREKQHLWLTPLRMDLPRSSMWFPVPPLPQCPVGCAASRRK